MATKNDAFLERQETKKVLYNIREKINFLYNLVSNEDFDPRFIGAIVDFKMFLEKIKIDGLQSLIKELHDIDFYSHINQDSYVQHLERVYNKYIEENSKKTTERPQVKERIKREDYPTFREGLEAIIAKHKNKGQDTQQDLHLSDNFRDAVAKAVDLGKKRKQVKIEKDSGIDDR